MRICKDHKGFSILELVVAIGIIGILASLSLTVLGRLKYANTEKMVTLVTDALRKQQVLAMSKNSQDESTYLHIYKVDKTYYMISSTESTYNSSTMGTHGTSLGTNITIYKRLPSGETYTDKEISGDDRIVIAYKKDGALKYPSGENIKAIVIEGRYKTIITLNKETGRFIRE